MKYLTPWLRSTGRLFMTVVDRTTDVAAFISGALIMILVLMITTAVLLRYYFDLSVAWSTELAEYFVYLLVILPTPWVLRKDAHVSVDVFLNFLSHRARRRIAVFINFLGAVIGFAFFYYSGLATYENYVKETLTLRIMPIPRYLLLLPMPIVSVLFSLQFLRKALENLLPSPGSAETGEEETASS